MLGIQNELIQGNQLGEQEAKEIFPQEQNNQIQIDNLNHQADFKNSENDPIVEPPKQNKSDLEVILINIYEAIKYKEQQSSEQAELNYQNAMQELTQWLKSSPYDGITNQEQIEKILQDLQGDYDQQSQILVAKFEQYLQNQTF